MVLISLQILLINFVIAGCLTAMIYFMSRRVRKSNPIWLFAVSSLGTFLGTMFARLLPNLTLNSNSIVLNNLVTSIPGISLALLFVYIWVKGSRSEGYV